MTIGTVLSQRPEQAKQNVKPGAGWRDVELGEIFEITSSKRVLQEQWQESGVPFYRAREIVRLAKEGFVANELFISEDLFKTYRKYGVPKPGDLMVSAVGTLGACYIVQPQDRFYFKDASVLRLSPKEEICPKFIKHAFESQSIVDQIQAGSGSTVGTLTIARAGSICLSLPPLEEQKRIAAILDQADALRRLRGRALDRLRDLGHATFREMFVARLEAVESQNDALTEGRERCASQPLLVRFNQSFGHLDRVIAGACSR